MLLALAAAAAMPAPPDLPSLPACAPRVAGPCTLPMPPLSHDALRTLLAGRQRVWWVSGDVLNVVARPTDDWALLCCSLQTPLIPIPGTDLAAVSVRVPEMDRAVIDVDFRPGPREADPPVYRGLRAPAAPARVATLAGRLTDHPIRSAALGETRTIHVYVPPGIEPGRMLPVIYLSDGGSTDFLRIAEAAILSGRIRPVIVVGIDAAPHGARDLRSDEYLPGADDARFAAHSRFVADEVIPFVEAHYPVARTPAERTVGGSSSGGMWALAMAADRPDLFGNAISLSMAGLTRPYGARLRRGRMFFGAGTFEPQRAVAARNAAEGAREGGAEVRLRVIPGGHGPLLWEIYWAEALDWMFPATGGAAGRAP